MSNWALINSRIKACTALQDPSQRLECLQKLYAETDEDGMVAFFIGKEFENLNQLQMALYYLRKAESKFPRAEYKNQAKDAQNRIILKLEKSEGDLTKIEASLREGFIVDPSLICQREGIELALILREEYKSKVVVIPTKLYSVLKERNFQEIFPLVFEWAWNLTFKDYEWLKSPEAAEKISALLSSSIPISQIWKLEQDPSVVDEIAIELREVATRLGFPIVSISDSLFKWIRKNGVAVLNLVSDDYKDFKKRFRKKYRGSLLFRLAVRGPQTVPHVILTYVFAVRPEIVQSPWNIIFPMATQITGSLLFQAIVIDP